MTVRRLRCLVLFTGLWLAQPGAAEDFRPLHFYMYQSWSTEAGLPQISVNDTVQDADGLLWVATQNGLVRFDGSDFEDLSAAAKQALGTAWMTRLYRDRRGQIWIGSIKSVARYVDGAFQPVRVIGGALGKVNDIGTDDGGRVCVAAEGLWCEQEGQLEPQPQWQGRVTALLEDPDGLWVADRHALALRSGGDLVRRYPLEPNIGLADVTALARSREGLWIGSSQGLFRLDATGFHRQALDPQSAATGVISLGVEQGGTLWVSTQDAVYRLLGGRVRERIGAEDDDGYGWVLSLRPDQDHGMWLGSQRSGLRYVWHPGPALYGRADGLHDVSLWSFWNDGTRLLAGTNDGVAELQGKTFRLLLPGDALPNPSAYSLLRDHRGRLLVGTRAGLARFDDPGGPAEQFPEIGPRQVNGLIEDNDGSVLAATSNGLFRIAEGRAQPVGAEAGLDAARVRYVLRDRQQQLWVGTESGLFLGTPGGFARVSGQGPAQAFVTALLELRDGRIVVGTYESGIYLHDNIGWRQYTAASGLPADGVFFLAQYGGALLVSYDNGVYRVPLDAMPEEGSPELAVEMLHIDEGTVPNRRRMRCCNGAGIGKGALFGGELWLPSLAGALRVPLSVAEHPAPDVRIASLRQQQHAVRPGPEVRLAPEQRDLELHYAVADFRSAAQLRYRYRLRGLDADWVDAGRRRTAYYTNLPAGAWVFDVQARYAHERWGETAHLAIDVPPTIGETWWFRGGLALLALALLFLLYRWRMARVERLNSRLEAIVAQRTRELQAANARLATANDALAAASVTDPLTSLHNRRFIQEQIGAILANLRRHREDSGRDLVIGILAIDIDRFKSVNDQYGHAVGDRVLQRVAAVLRSEKRDGDYLLRWGGEEFVVITTEDERGTLPPIAERLRLAVERSTAGSGEPARITVSIGYASYPLPGMDPDAHDWHAAMTLADQALYGAKGAGRNRVASIEIREDGTAEWPEQLSAALLAEWYASGKARLLVYSGSSTVAA